jgi:hypothetical protein
VIQLVIPLHAVVEPCADPAPATKLTIEPAPAADLAVVGAALTRTSCLCVRI